MIKPLRVARPERNKKALDQSNESSSSLLLLAQQNFLRGSISQFRSKSYSKKDKRREALHSLRRGISENLLDSRLVLPESQFRNFLTWQKDTVHTLVPDSVQKPIAYDYLGGFYSQTLKIETSLAREMLWIARRLECEHKRINQFRAQAEKIEDLVFHRRLSEALDEIREFSKAHGESFWAIQLRIALEQSVGGLDAQKKYSDSLKRIYKRGVLGYVAYYTSVRNEERTSWERFCETVNSNLNRSAYQDSVRNYLRYRLLCKWPSNKVEFADILRLEQSHNIVDLYETFVQFLQELLKKPDQLGMALELSQCLEILFPIRDFRLEKMKFALGTFPDSSLFPLRSTEVSDLIFQSHVVSAIKLERSLRTGQHPDPWAIIYSGFAKASLSSRDRLSRDKDCLSNILANALERNSNFASNMNYLVKRIVNFSGLPCFLGLHAFLETLQNRNQRNFFYTGAISLNSRFYGAEDFDVCKVDASAYYSTVDWKTTTALEWKNLYPWNTQDNSGPISIFSSAVKEFRQGNTDNAISLLHLINNDASYGPFRPIVSFTLTACYMDIADRKSIINLVAKEAEENEYGLSLIPIAEALENPRWPDFKDSGDFIACITLHALWKITDNDDVATLLRHAFSNQLKRLGIKRPSELADIYKMFPAKRVSYFLRNVCTPFIMDLYLGFSSSKEVQEERQAVCAVIKEIEPERGSDCDVEIYEINRKLKIAEGVKLIDSSRIHVGIESITKWANKNLREDFTRYVDLVKSGVGNEGNFEKIVDDFLTGRIQANDFSVPTDEADAILADILTRLRSEFLSNPNYGLDYFISKRIRHQSFIGLLRDPLEFGNLITSKDSEFGSYKPNDYWIERIANLSEEAKAEVQSTFNEFSSAFDNTLIKIKDEYLQIKSEDQPTGIFNIPITTGHLYILRSLVKKTSFEEFLKTVFVIFWTLLNPTLIQASTLIEKTLKEQLSRQFELLDSKLHTLLESHSVSRDISTAIRTASSEVQRHLDSIASWFIISENVDYKKTFTLRESIDIAVESATKSHRDFQPNIELNVTEDTELYYQDLLFVTDAIFIALDNVKRHSQIKRGADIHIDCHIEPSTQILLLSITSTVKQHLKRDLVEAKLASLRASIAAGDFGRVASREGGSGFLKLAAALCQTPKSFLKFGFKGEDKFELVISFPIDTSSTIKE